MSTELNLLPCPFCNQPDGAQHLPACWFLLRDIGASRARLAQAWNRRASPAAAVPVDALPPLPKPWEERIGAPYKGKSINDIPLTAQIHHMQAEIFEWRARAAVEADRAQHPQSMSNAEAAQWARANGLNAPAAWDGAVTDYGSPVDNSADRAQQGEPVAAMGEELKAAPFHLSPHMAYAIARKYAGKVIATKAAAPANSNDEPTKEMIAAGARYLRIMSCPELEAKQIYLAMRRAAPVPDTGIPTNEDQA